jgi:hypothetical protein
MSDLPFLSGLSALSDKREQAKQDLKGSRIYKYKYMGDGTWEES